MRTTGIARLLLVFSLTGAATLAGPKIDHDATTDFSQYKTFGLKIGTPLDKVYPRENTELQQAMMRDHLVVSQFPAGHPVQRSNFPRRNRVMALIADASVIVEAGEKSGTLSQGWEALRLGRPLFLMRSVVEDPSLKWPGQMIEYGATVLRKPEELLEVLPEAGEDFIAELAL